VASAYDATLSAAADDVALRPFVDALDVRAGPLGISLRPGSCAANAAQAHESLRAGDLVTLRVGEVYEFYGVDALVVAVSALPHCTVRLAEVKCVVCRDRMAAVLSALVVRGWRVAVHEESEVVCTPRIRVLRKIVTDASPHYSHASWSSRRGRDGSTDSDGGDAVVSAESARPVLGVHAKPDGSFDAVEFRLDRDEMVVHTEVSRAHVEALLPQAARPVACLRAVPPFVAAATGLSNGTRGACGAQQGCCVLGTAPDTTLLVRMAAHVKTAYMVNTSAFRQVRADSGCCAPTPRYTLENLGMCEDCRTPSLLDACCTKRACAAVREQLDAWLRRPPAGADAVRRCVAQMRVNVDRPLPRAVPLRRTKWRAHVGGCDAAHLVATYHNVELAIRLRRGRGGERGHDDSTGGAGASARDEDEASRPMDDALLAMVADTMGCAGGATSLDLEGLLGLLRTVVDGESGSLHAHLTSAYAGALKDATAALEHWKASQSYGAFTVLHGKIALYGRPDGDARLPFRDRTQRLVAERHTTTELGALQQSVDDATRDLDDAEEQILSDVAERVTRAYDAEATVVNAHATAVCALADHVRAVGRTWRPVDETRPAGGDASGHEGGGAPSRDETDSGRGGGLLRLDGLWPYWLSDGVVNEVSVDSGSPVVLTGPNGGGKSTVLRSVCAAALLGQVGLLAPVRSGRVPTFSHVFLRAGTHDCAVEGRSAFAAEMTDLATVLSAARDALVLLDEPCRGTSASEGGALLGAYLQALPQSACTILSTHFLDMECTGCVRMQMVATVDHATAVCRPEYRLTAGRCTNSLALHCALAAGMPCDVVADARTDDDEETAALIALRQAGLHSHRMHHPQGLVPPGVVHAVYVLLTDAGVYVGEARDLQDRLRTHAASKNVHTVFYSAVDDRTSALALEAQLIRKMSHMNVRLLSVADGNHACT
jgi:predicted GIY-YIG superfamily endonuclease